MILEPNSILEPNIAFRHENFVYKRKCHFRTQNHISCSAILELQCSHWRVFFGLHCHFSLNFHIFSNTLQCSPVAQSCKMWMCAFLLFWSLLSLSFWMHCGEQWCISPMGSFHSLHWFLTCIFNLGIFNHHWWVYEFPSHCFEWTSLLWFTHKVC